MTHERPVPIELPPLPWDPSEALQASQAHSAEQLRVEDEVRQAFKDFGRAQKLYAVALARGMLDLKRGGVAITATETLAKGDEKIAELREARDIAEGVKEAAKVAAWRANKDRDDINELIRWSARRDLAHPETGGVVEPQGTSPYVFGRRSAA